MTEGEPTLIYKTCGSCMQSMPIDQFDGRMTICKGCNRLKATAVKKHTVRMMRAADMHLLQAAKRLIAERPEPTDGVPDIGTITECIVNAWGGPHGIAIQHVATYLMAAPGSATRQRMLADVRGYLAKSSELGYAKKPAELMTDEELEQFIAERTRRTFRTKGLELVDGEEDEAIAG
jgi:hypothetical protein